MNIIKSTSILALAILTISAQANLLTNGDFEKPVVGGWGAYTSISGWTAVQDKIEIGTAGTYGVTGTSGQVLELDAYHNAIVQQSVSLSAGSYSLSFGYARRKTSMSGRPLNTADFDVLWNGAVVYSGRDLTSTSFTTTQISLLGNSGTNILQLRGMGNDDSFGAIVDNFSLSKNPEAVPEPASLLALATGLAAVIRRKLAR
ncbi:MAG: PEP-CTERM sorting domain-containing protein [Fimbriimonas sp.]